MQAQIDETLQAVLGDRKKYMKLLKNYSTDFYKNLGRETPSDGEFIIPKNFRQTVIQLDSNDEESDNSIERMKRHLEIIKQDKNYSGLGTGIGLGGVDQE